MSKIVCIEKDDEFHIWYQILSIPATATPRTYKVVKGAKRMREEVRYLSRILRLIDSEPSVEIRAARNASEMAQIARAKKRWFDEAVLP